MRKALRSSRLCGWAARPHRPQPSANKQRADSLVAPAAGGGLPWPVVPARPGLSIRYRHIPHRRIHAPARLCDSEGHNRNRNWADEREFAVHTLTGDSLLHRAPGSLPTDESRTGRGSCSWKNAARRQTSGPPQLSCMNLRGTQRLVSRSTGCWCGSHSDLASGSPNPARPPGFPPRL